MRATWSAAPAGAPPARMNRRSGGSSASRRSISALEPCRRRRRRATALVDARRDPLARIGQLRAEREQVALNANERLVEIGIEAGGARQAEPGVQLVDLAVGVDAGVGLADARAVEQRRLAGVAGARVDFHGRREIIRDAPETPPSRQPPARIACRRRRPPALPAAAAHLVPAPRPRPAVAEDRRPVPHPRLGDHAAADAGRSRAAEVRRVAATSIRRSTRSRPRRKREVTADLVSARLQHPAAAAADDRPRGGRALRRPAAGRRGDAAVVQGDRRLHGRRDPQLRVPPARRDSRHQRRARAVSRVRRPRAIRRATR